jgi:hypothetical protein
MNRGALKTALQALGYATDTDTQQNEAINGALRRLQAARRWSWQVAEDATGTIVAGSTNVATPASNILHVDQFYVRDPSTLVYYPVEWRPYEEVRRRRLDSSSSTADRGTPSIWNYSSPAVLEFAPVADKTYTPVIEYIKTLTLPTADSDEIPIPDTYEDLILWWAVERITFRERDWNAYNAAKTCGQIAYSEVLAAEGIEQRQNARHVARSGVWDRASYLGPGSA